MSKNVLIEMEEGKPQPMDAKDMLPLFRNYPMICNGRIHGDGKHRCTAPMSARFSRKNGMCIGFTEKEVKNYPHAMGCEHDRRSDTTTISRFNSRGKCANKEQYLSRLIETRSRKKKPIDGGDKNGNGGTNVIDTEDNNVIEKHIKMTTNDPHNLANLAPLLSSLEIDHMYMDHQVQDWIVDNRTFSYHFSKGLPEGWMLVVANLCNPDSLGFSVDSNEWILADCTFNGDPENKGFHWFYRLVCNSKTWKKITKFTNRKKRGDYYVVVCAKWGQDSQHTNLYISEKTTCKMVAFVKKEKMNMH